MHGLRPLNDLGARALFVVLSVVALLVLAAIVASPARADLAGGAGDATDQVAESAETTTPTATDDGTTVEGDGAPGGEETFPAPGDQIVEDEISPVGDEAGGASENITPMGDDAFEAVIAPLAVEDELDGSEPDMPVEDMLIVDAISPVVEPLEDDYVEGAPPYVEIADEAGNVVTDVVIMVPPQVDVVRLLPLFVSPTVASPASIEVSALSVIPTISIARESVLSPQPVRYRSQQLSGLFTKQLVAEMTLFHLTDLTLGASAVGSSAAPVPERETPAMAAYVPVAGTMPAVGGAGASSSTGSSLSGSNFFGGLDTFSFFAAMAALLALCLLGWIRDSSRSGRSIFPSHGGRPG